MCKKIPCMRNHLKKRFIFRKSSRWQHKLVSFLFKTIVSHFIVRYHFPTLCLLVGIGWLIHSLPFTLSTKMNVTQIYYSSHQKTNKLGLNQVCYPESMIIRIMQCKILKVCWCLLSKPGSEMVKRYIYFSSIWPPCNIIACVIFNYILSNAAYTPILECSTLFMAGFKKYMSTWHLVILPLY